MAKVKRVTLEEIQVINQADALCDTQSAFAKRLGRLTGKAMIELDQRVKVLNVKQDLGQ